MRIELTSIFVDGWSRPGVAFTQEPTDIGPAVVAVLDDTCGNLVQLVSEKPAVG